MTGWAVTLAMTYDFKEKCSKVKMKSEFHPLAASQSACLYSLSSGHSKIVMKYNLTVTEQINSTN